MTKYFEYFPDTRYTVENKEYLIRNIGRRAVFKEALDKKPFVFMPYTVVEDDRAEDVAHLYYGSVEYTWLIWIANDIIDPYSDWPMTYLDFNDFIIKKYKEQSGQVGFDVIAWTQNTAIDDNILYYENSEGIQISKGTYAFSYLDPEFEAAEWKAMRIYDWEFARNEEKRQIELINKDFASEIVSEFKELMRG